MLVEWMRHPEMGSVETEFVLCLRSLLPMMHWEGCMQLFDLGLLGLLNCEK